MNWLLILVVLIIFFLLLSWFGKVLKATVGTAIALLVLLLVLNFGFNITPWDIWQETVKLWETGWQFFNGTQPGGGGDARR